MGIIQGKAFVKEAHTLALEGQKDAGHLDGFLECIRELESFLEKLPNSDSDEFDWGKAIDIGANAFNSLNDIHAKSKGSSLPSGSKNVVTNGKKVLSDYINTICKAFFMGPVQTWFFKISSEFRKFNVAAEIPNIGISKWTSMKASKQINGDATKISNCAISTMSIMKEVHAGITTTQSAVLSKALESLEAFKETWQIVKDFQMVTLKMESSFQSVVELCKSLLVGQVHHDVRSSTMNLAELMSKVGIVASIPFSFVRQSVNCSLILLKSHVEDVCSQVLSL